MIRKLRRGVLIGVWTIIALYLTVILLLNIPAVQTYLGARTGAVLAEMVGSSVSIQRVDVGLLNRVIIDDVAICDTAGLPLLTVGRASVKVSLADLLQGRVTISSAQLFGMKVNAYKDEQGAANYQFLLDAFATDDDGPSKPFSLKINSLIIRRSELIYNDRAAPETDTFSPHHLAVKDISAHIIATALASDSLNIHVKRLSCAEQSGLTLVRMQMKVVAGAHGATLTDCEVRLPTSQLHLAAQATYTLLRDTTMHINDLQYSATLYDTSVVPAEVPLVPLYGRGAAEPVTLAATLRGDSQQVHLDSLTLQQGERLSLLLSARAQKNAEAWDWQAALHTLRTNGEGITTLARTIGKDDALPAFTDALGQVTLVADAAQQGGTLTAQAALSSALGAAEMQLTRAGDVVRATVAADSLNLAVIADNAALGTCSLTINGEGTLAEDKLATAAATATVSTLVFREHAYHDVSLTADYAPQKHLRLNATVADALGSIAAAVDYYPSAVPLIDFHLTADSVQLDALHLTDLYPAAAFSCAVEGSCAYEGLENTTGALRVSNLTKTTPAGTYTLHSLLLTLEHGFAGAKRLTCQSDFANVRLEGAFQYATLYNSFYSALSAQLPILPFASGTTPTNQFDLYATLMPSAAARELLNIPLAIDEPAHLIAKFDDLRGTFSINADAKNIHYNGTNYYDNYLIVAAPRDTLRTTLCANARDDDGNALQVLLTAKAYDNYLASSIDFDSHYGHHIQGSLNTLADFNHRAPTGQQRADIAVQPSQILVADTVWTIAPAHLTYYDNYLKVDNFSVSHNQQFINIDGTAQKGTTDDILVTTHDVNVAYILDFIHFTAVAFDGYATGTARLRTLFSDPTIEADMTVADFHFEGGAMGTAHLLIGYNFAEGSINIDAVAQEEDWHNTTIKGYVSTKNKDINLAIVPFGASINFVGRYCSDFAAITNAVGWGTLNVIGPLKEVQLVGDATVTADVYLPALNTTYHLEEQAVRFEPDDIIFVNDTLTDVRHERGILTGHLPHRHLGHFSYDISVAATNLLALDLADFGEDAYLGTVYATGNCRVRAVRSGTQIDVDIAPEEGSFITYNATAPDRVSDSFVTWIDGAAKDISALDEYDEESARARQMASDLTINFLLRCDDRSQLRVLMDDHTGDLITLNGSGVITATYYNKGAFSLYGNYLVSSGTYRMTIQNVLQRDFTFLPGGTLSFSGDAGEAQINLLAEYSLASVPLADINIGSSFSNSNVRVDCLMNITGTPENPQVDFSLDLPTLSTDAKQMIMNMFADTEELNQQVIYLIAVGRFLNQYSNNSSTQTARYNQTSLAMQSFLSGTVSQQLNNVLESIIGSKQWNFGANISPGEEGFNDAEYEGLISGRMFNNRLLFNGQFGYRDNPNATSSFIGDFDLRYLLVPSGSIAVRVYNETNNRYFTKNTLTTQGVGLIIKKDFTGWRELFRRNKKLVSTPQEAAPADSTATAL